MWTAVISDIHSNLPALNAVIKDMPKKVKQVWFLGDLFGYGPNPKQVFDILQAGQLKGAPLEVWLAGNHDLALANKSPYDGSAGMSIHPDFQESWKRNRKALGAGIVNAVAAKPKEAEPQGCPVRVYLTHGFPREREEERVMLYDYKQAPLKPESAPGLALAFYLRQFKPGVRVWIVGHSHLRTGWRWDGSRWDYLDERAFGTRLDGSETGNLNHNDKCTRFSLPLQPAPAEDLYILNPGSVGMPNDGFRGADNCIRYAKYMLLDLSTNKLMLEYRTVSYDARGLSGDWMNYPGLVRRKLDLEEGVCNET
jgi:predicted phosphodiesterase